ncbi:unnamed protein product [Aphis gossypii]|uniref:Uncharacterized protein n=1 Tax=Aphis gossypii TaxID=80765 RepID=A0A9P0NFK7_APHGO|nr:unnamed protein product [Aphis gossypii]
MLNKIHRTASIQYYLFVYNESIITKMTFYSLDFLGTATSSCITMKLFHSPSTKSALRSDYLVTLFKMDTSNSARITYHEMNKFNLYYQGLTFGSGRIFLISLINNNYLFIHNNVPRLMKLKSLIHAVAVLGPRNIFYYYIGEPRQSLSTYKISYFLIVVITY